MSLYSLIGTDDDPNTEEHSLALTPLVPTKIPYMIQNYTTHGALVYNNVVDQAAFYLSRKNDIVTLHTNNVVLANTGANLANVIFVVLFDESFLDVNNNPLPNWAFPDFDRNIIQNTAFPCNFVTGSGVIFHGGQEMFTYNGFVANVDKNHFQFRLSFGGYRLDDGTPNVENINNGDTITVQKVIASWIGVPI